MPPDLRLGGTSTQVDPDDVSCCNTSGEKGQECNFRYPDKSTDTEPRLPYFSQNVPLSLLSSNKSEIKDDTYVSYLRLLKSPFVPTHSPSVLPRFPLGPKRRLVGSDDLNGSKTQKTFNHITEEYVKWFKIFFNFIQVNI